MGATILYPYRKPRLIGGAIASTPPQWSGSGIGNGSGNTIVVPDLTASAGNGFLVVAALSVQTGNFNSVPSPPGWTRPLADATQHTIWVRTIDADVGSHTWTLTSQGISRGAIQTTFKRGAIVDDATSLSTVTVPDLTSPGEGAILLVTTSRPRQEPFIDGTGNLFRLQASLTFGTGGYQSPLEMASFIERDLPAGLITGRTLNIGGGNPIGLRMHAMIIGRD